MKNDGNSGNENADGLDLRGDKALWDLLGQAEPPKASPYFSRRVLREVSLQAGAQGSAHWWQPAALWRACRRLPRTAFVAGTPAAAVLLLFLGLHGNSPLRQTPAATPSVVTRPAAGPGKEVPPALVTDEDIAASLTKDEAALAAVAEEDDAATPSAATAPAAQPAPNVAAASALPEDISEQDVEVIAELDTLREREQNRLWTEDSARF